MTAERTDIDVIRDLAFYLGKKLLEASRECDQLRSELRGLGEGAATTDRLIRLEATLAACATLTGVFDAFTNSPALDPSA